MHGNFDAQTQINPHSLFLNPPSTHTITTQLRIHTTEACDLYVHTVSGPIIEDCARLRFAPYALRYPALEAHMAVRGCLGLFLLGGGGS